MISTWSITAPPSFQAGGNAGHSWQESRQSCRCTTYTQTPQVLVSIDKPLSIIPKRIPRQLDIDKIVRNIETHVIHSLELPIKARDLIKVYQHSICFHDIYQYITDGKLPSSVKAQKCIRVEALNYVVINNFLSRIDTRKDRDLDKGNLFLLVIPEKYKPIIFNM